MIIPNKILDICINNGWVIYNINDIFIIKLFNKNKLSNINNIENIKFFLNKINKYNISYLNNNILTKINKIFNMNNIHCEIFSKI
jgi:hypothetical protein